MKEKKKKENAMSCRGVATPFAFALAMQRTDAGMGNGSLILLTPKEPKQKLIFL
jgi:hypothetical protein